jgi:hypothetical protein
LIWHLCEDISLRIQWEILQIQVGLLMFLDRELF